MVMRNRHDGAGTPGWWDDLPPQIRARIDPPPPARPAPDPPPRPAGAWVGEWGRLAVLFLAVAVANAVVLLLALSFLSAGSAAPFAAPGR